MEKFVRIEGIAAPLMFDNIDTDAIIPAEWMSNAEPEYARSLFGNWRYTDSAKGIENPDFILNRDPWRQASILISGANFGCGSSREHAVWALRAFGIRCVLAGGFSDIFHGNALRNGFLPVRLPMEVLQRLAAQVSDDPDARVAVDLERCEVRAPDGTAIPFEIGAGPRSALLEGLDPIGVTLKNIDLIDAFQTRDRAQRPWIHEAGFNATDRIAPAPAG